MLTWLLLTHQYPFVQANCRHFQLSKGMTHPGAPSKIRINQSSSNVYGQWIKNLMKSSFLVDLIRTTEYVNMTVLQKINLPHCSLVRKGHFTTSMRHLRYYSSTVRLLYRLCMTIVYWNISMRLCRQHWEVGVYGQEAELHGTMAATAKCSQEEIFYIKLFIS